MIINGNDLISSKEIKDVVLRKANVHGVSAKIIAVSSEERNIVKRLN